MAEAHQWPPFDADSVQHITKEQLRILDQVAYRFTKLQDSMGQKVLPTILDLDRNLLRPTPLHYWPVPSTVFSMAQHN
jgi:hypothetical protein